MPSFLDTLAGKVPQLRIALDAERAGDLDKARAAYLELADQPQLTAISLHQLGAIAERQSDPSRAATLFQMAVRLDPKRPIFHQSLAAALERLAKRSEALDALMGFAQALNSTGERDLAIATYRRILEMDGNRHDTCINIGALLSNRDSRAGVPYLLKGIALCGWQQPRVRALLDRLMPRLLAQGLFPAELAALSGVAMAEAKLLELGVTNLGVALGDLGLIEEAILCHRFSLELDPGFADAHFNLSLLLLGQGAYEEGWKEYEWRWRWSNCPEPRRRLPCPRWQGQALAGKTIFVYGEQGFGDVLQFACLIERLPEAGHVVFEVIEPLRSLIRETFESKHVSIVARQKDVNRIDMKRRPDFAIPLMSVPLQLGLGMADLPLATNYLRASDAKAALWRDRLGTASGTRIGIAWAGRPTHKNDRNRSIALNRLRPLFELPGLSWHGLQLAPQAAEPSGLGLPIQDVSSELDDFTDTAAVIANLDLVITVDTAVAHLAAAMGKPTWVLLPFFADWRWLTGRSDSPWYPSVRLFRQQSLGDWEGVVAAVAAALERRPVTGGSGRPGQAP
jgi:tetratricopeptide (TPR) repeat protein